MLIGWEAIRFSKQETVVVIMLYFIGLFDSISFYGFTTTHASNILSGILFIFKHIGLYC
jgi:hypothetical protein